MLKITCTKCNASLQVPPNLAGRTITCPKCKKPTLVALAPVEIEPEQVELEEIVDDGGAEDAGAEDAAFMPVSAKSPPKPAKAPSKTPAKAPEKTPAKTAKAGAKPPAKTPGKKRSRDDDEADFEPEFEMDEPAKSRKGLWIGLGVGGGVLVLALIGVGVAMFMKPAAPADPFAELKAKMEAELRAKGFKIEPGKIPDFPADMIPKDVKLPPNVDPKNLVPPDIDPKTLIPGPTPKSDQVDAIEKARRAVVLLRGTAGGGAKIAGSGFFAFEKGLVATNAEVLDMRLPDAREPRKLEVVVQSGEPEEKTLSAKVLGVDREFNLALLKVDGPTESLPEPVPVESPLKKIGAPSEMTVFGVASGAKSLAARNVAVRMQARGQPRCCWLVDGELAPDESGGPLVDRNGNAVGAAFIVHRGTHGAAQSQISVGIISDRLLDLRRGRVFEMLIQYPYREGADIRVPVSVECLDPMKHVRKVEIEYWAGPPGPQRPPTDQKEAGQQKRNRVPVSYADGKAAGEFSMPTPKKGQNVWIRTVLSDESGKSWRGWAYSISGTTVPLERRPIAIRNNSASVPERSISLQSEFTIDTSRGDVDEDQIEAKLLERCEKDATGQRLTLRTGPLTRKAQYDAGAILRLGDDTARAMQSCPINLAVGADGRISDRGTFALAPQLEPKARAESEAFLGRIVDALVAASPKLPTSLEPNKDWSTSWSFSFMPGREPEEAESVVNCQYEGVRKSDEGELASFRIFGDVRPRKGKMSAVLFGKVQGRISIDVATGMVTGATVQMAGDFVSKTDSIAGYVLSVRLERDPGNLYKIVPKESPPPVITAKTPTKTPVEVAKVPTKTPDSPIAKSPSGPLGDKTTVGDLVFETVKVDARTVLRSLTWAVDGKSFYCLQSTGKLQRFSADDLSVIADSDLGPGCTGMALSSEGLLVAVPASEEALLVDTTSLAVRRKVSIPDLDRVAAGPKAPLAAAITKGGEIALVDVKAAKVVLKQRVDELVQGAGTFFLAVMTPDGKYIFAESKLGKLHRLHVVEHTLVHEQASGPIASKSGRIDVSPDGNYVCLSSETGNAATGLRTFVYYAEDMTSPDVVLNAGGPPRTVGFDSTRDTIYAQNSKFALISFSKAGRKLHEYELPGVGETRQIVCGKTGDVLVLTQERLLRARRAK